MTSRERYWAEHLAAIAAEGITTKAYAKREQLPVTALYYWRSRFKHEAGPEDTSSRQLVPIQLATPECDDTGCTLILGPGIELKLAQLPHPQWLAALAATAAGSYWGRGAVGKVSFVVAVETTDDGRPLKAQFRRVNGFTQAVLKDYAQAGVAPTSHVVSDALSIKVVVT